MPKHVLKAMPKSTKQAIRRAIKKAGSSAVAGGSRVAGRTRKRGAGSSIAGRVKRGAITKRGKPRRPRQPRNIFDMVTNPGGYKKKASGSRVAGRTRKRGSGSMVAGGKWKDRLTYIPNKIVKHTLGRFAKHVWKRNKRR